MQTPVRVALSLGDNEVVIETNKLAKQAQGSVTIRCGDTIVLVTACAASKAKEGIDFLPLTVEFIEKTFAAGKIPGGFFKREGRPTEDAILKARFIDRPIRPLFPENYHFETQVIATVLSVDESNDPGMLAMVGASAALIISDIPFNKPIAGCRVAKIDGKFVINPPYLDLENATLELVVAGSEDAVLMVEGEADEASEAELIEAIEFAHQSLKPVIAAQKELQSKVGKAKREIEKASFDQSLASHVKTFTSKVKEALNIRAKHERYDTLGKIQDEILNHLSPTAAERDPNLVKQAVKDYEELKSNVMREMILKDKARIDGRGLADIRPISCEVGLLPRSHGSGLFTRGETQALVSTTLGSSDDEQTIDALMGEYSKKFMLHYNFPPFSVGEVKPLRSPGRREIGHGALAERALARMLPPHNDFPYTVRIVSEILESNGSSSMASVCGGSLSLMDAGVPIKAPVAGIAMGLIKEGNEFAVLSDILGDEDHLGDMDFKVTGTDRGVTALQMDIKIEGVSKSIMEQALKQAKEGRLHILGKMSEAISTSRTTLSEHAPKIVTTSVRKEKIKDVIGSGGKNIKGIIEATGAKIDIDDDGSIKIFSNDNAAIEQALSMIKDLTAEAEVGKTYTGLVRKIMEFGAFVEILPKTDGLVHISELSHKRVKAVTDVLKEGDKVTVKCIGVDEKGKIKLSIKALQPKE